MEAKPSWKKKIFSTEILQKLVAAAGCSWAMTSSRLPIILSLPTKLSAFNSTFWILGKPSPEKKNFMKQIRKRRGGVNRISYLLFSSICHDDATCVHERGRNQISPFRTQVMFSVFRGPKYDDIRPNHTKKYQKITFKVLFSLPPKIH